MSKIDCRARGGFDITENNRFYTDEPNLLKHGFADFEGLLWMSRCAGFSLSRHFCRVAMKIC